MSRNGTNIKLVARGGYCTAWPSAAWLGMAGHGARCCVVVFSHALAGRQPPRAAPFSVLMHSPASQPGPLLSCAGVRNTVGFDFHPATKKLYFTDNGRDSELGGQHLGWPGGGRVRCSATPARLPKLPGGSAAWVEPRRLLHSASTCSLASPRLPRPLPTPPCALPDWDLKSPATTDNRPDCELNYAPAEGGCQRCCPAVSRLPEPEARPKEATRGWAT